MNKYSAEIRIVLRNGILDAQGKTIESSLRSLDFPQLTNVKVGKVINLQVEAEDETSAKKLVDNASKKLLANTIIEDYFITLTKVE
ncbi:MAG: phosphoribosylformylglycinamidine synthase subunit PurS [Bacteroidetes bacterium]|nr:phosphoribosylformylglycinamidine synthase subunit PurS [Bacteroidota bacterium]MBR3090719.1 phosphoribosylformylglycinamidine synthase subunit PurS [Bacteroidota bacterium]